MADLRELDPSDKTRRQTFPDDITGRNTDVTLSLVFRETLLKEKRVRAEVYPEGHHCFCAQITAALELEEQARKQRLSYKVEQLISAMSFESWERSLCCEEAGPPGLTRTPWPQPPRELEAPPGPGNSEHPQPNSFHHGSTEPPADQMKELQSLQSRSRPHGRNMSREGSNTACIYLLLFLPEGRFLLARNSILCVHECAFATCWRTPQDSESKRRQRFILQSVEKKLIRGWNRDLFNVAGSKPGVGRQCLAVQFHKLYFCTCTFEDYQLQVKYPLTIL